MPRVRPIGLRAPLRPPQPARLRRLGEMHARTNPAQLLDHEPPARRRLQPNLELLPREPAKEPPHARAVRRNHTRPRHLTGLAIQPLSRDLRPMLIQTHHDRHRPTPFRASLTSRTRRALTRAASSPTHRIPWDTVGTSYSNGRPRGCNPRAP